MFRRLAIIAATMLALAILLAACGEEDADPTPTNGSGSPADPTATISPTETPEAEQPDLDGTFWELSALPGRDVDLDVPVTLSFEEGQITGNAGCNDYGSPYSTDADGTITFAEIYQTEMDCEIGMDVESEYLDALAEVELYAVDDGRLELQDANGNTLLVFMQVDVEASVLEGTTWILSDFDGEQIPDEFEDIPLTFNDGQIGGTVCNSYGGNYELNGDSVLRIYDVFHTEMFCMEPDGIMDLESGYIAALGDVADYRIEGDQLTLLDANGAALMAFTAGEDSADMPLDNTAWVVTELDGEPVIEDLEMTMEFTDGMVTGNSGCNGYGGSYTGMAEGELDLHDITMTLVACAEPEGVMDQETSFHSALREISAYELGENTLRLLDDEGAVRIVLEAADRTEEPSGNIDVQGTGWVLTAMNGQPLESDLPYTLQFTVNGPTGKAGCMSYWATFKPEDDGTFNRQNNQRSTFDAFCGEDEDAISLAETYVVTLMEASSYFATAENLQIMNKQGETTLEFRRGLAGGDLDGTSWILASMHGEPLVPVTEITLEFDEEHATGSGGCNGYGGPYMVAEPGTVAIADVARTEMGCVEPDGVMEQETAYFDALLRVVGYEMTDDSLTLMDADGEAILTFEPASNDTGLIGTDWLLEEMNEREVDPDSGVMLYFGADSLGGWSGCNSYALGYESMQLDSENLVISAVNTNQEWCELETTETEYYKTLTDVLTYDLSTGSLQLKDESGGTILRFERLP